VELTRKGVVRAKRVFERHKILTKFFHEILGLSLDVATEDACRIEHHIHREAVNRLVEFMEFIENYVFKDKTGFSSFGDLVKKGDMRPKSHQKSTHK
jgi:Mn-dependent DtxR family transcriptional regulator